MASKVGPSNLSSILRVIGAMDDHNEDHPPTRSSSPKDWSDLIERVRAAAARVKEVEAESHEQEEKVRELLDRVRDDMKLAHDKIRIAEANARDVQIRADALLKAADERVKSAEERARVAEDWLARIARTISEEFDASRAGRLDE